MATTVKLRIRAASRETTLPHGAATLGLDPFAIGSGRFRGRHNRDGGVRAHVCARLTDKQGGFVVCFIHSRRVCSTVSKKKIGLAQVFLNLHQWLLKQSLVVY